MYEKERLKGFKILVNFRGFNERHWLCLKEMVERVDMLNLDQMELVVVRGEMKIKEALVQYYM